MNETNTFQAAPVAQPAGPALEAAAPVRHPPALEPTPGPGPDAESLPAPPNEAPGPGIYRDLGSLPPSTVITEDGLAEIMGKDCRESIKRAVERGELPRPVKIMGKNCWTCRAIVQHLEDRLASEARKIARLRPNA